jgi:hypothetical protein
MIKDGLVINGFWGVLYAVFYVECILLWRHKNRVINYCWNDIAEKKGDYEYMKCEEGAQGVSKVHLFISW